MENSTLIIAGWLIDGSGGPVHQDMLFKVRDGVILWIRESGSFDKSNQSFIDLSQCTVVPGLIDSHTHLFISGTEDPNIRQRRINADFKDSIKVIKKNLIKYIECGVVALRDGGDHAAHTLAFRDEFLPHEEIPITLRAAGRAWHAPGRYGKMIGRPITDGRTLTESILGDNQNIDHIKILNSGINSLTDFGKQTPHQFEAGQLKNAVKAGNSLGIKTMIHANGELPVKYAIDAGCHSIEHGYLMGKENLMMMADKGIIWVPTLVPMAAHASLSGAGNGESEIAKKYLDHQLDQIRLANDYGVTMAVGTDAGSPGVHHGPAVFKEIELFMEAGLSPEGAIQCATSNGARLMGIENESGVLASGMPATFLAIRGIPDSLPESPANLKAVYINGRPWKRSDNDRRPLIQ